MQVQVTMTFDSAEAAAEFLSGKGSKPVKASTTASPAPSPAHTERTAEAAQPQAAAQETKALDFDKDVLPKLKEFAGKDKAKFGELMKKHGLTKAADLQAKPDIWAEVVEACG